MLGLAYLWLDCWLSFSFFCIFNFKNSSLLYFFQWTFTIFRGVLSPGRTERSLSLCETGIWAGCSVLSLPLWAGLSRVSLDLLPGSKAFTVSCGTLHMPVVLTSVRYGPSPVSLAPLKLLQNKTFHTPVGLTWFGTGPSPRSALFSGFLRNIQTCLHNCWTN